MTAEEREAGPWVNFWLHNEFLVLQGATKMSKSSGNFLTLQSLIDKGYDALDYRYFLLGSHYRKQIYFSWEAMDGAKNSRKSLASKIARLIEKSGIASASEIDEKKAIETAMEEFRENLCDDLNTPKALSAMQMAAGGKFGSDAAKILATVKKMDEVLGLKIIECAADLLSKQRSSENAENHSDDGEAAEIDALLARRAEAKKAKDFATADKIRNDLAARGISIIDTPNGTTWKRNK